MAIISGPSPRLTIWDPATSTKVDQKAISATFNLSCYPAHDGRHLWITRRTTQTVTPLDLGSDTYGSTINIGTNPVGIWIDGRILWSISTAGVLRRIDMETGTVIETLSLAADVYLGLTGNKRYLWSMDTTTGNVIQIDTSPTSGPTVIGGFTKPANASDLHHDTRFIWILTGASGVQGVVRQYDPATGTEVGSFNVTNYSLSDSPTGICGDDRYIYNTELIQ